jgi:hypothetical protein
MKFAYTLSIIGLLVEFIGVIGIFFIKVKGLKKTSEYKIIRRNPNSNDNLRQDINDFEKEVNKNIDETNLKNEGNNKKANYFFILITIGFILQLISSAMQYLSCLQ